MALSALRKVKLPPLRRVLQVAAPILAIFTLMIGLRIGAGKPIHVPAPSCGHDETTTDKATSGAAESCASCVPDSTVTLAGEPRSPTVHALSEITGCRGES